MSGELPAVVLGWQGGKKRQESTRDQLKSDLFVGAGPGCGDLGQAGGLSTSPTGLEASILRLDEGGRRGMLERDKGWRNGFQ